MDILSEAGAHGHDLSREILAREEKEEGMQGGKHRVCKRRVSLAVKLTATAEERENVEEKGQVLGMAKEIYRGKEQAGN